MSKLPANSLARWAAYLGIVLGLALFAHGVQTLLSDVQRPLPYSVSILIIGGLEVALSLLMLIGRRAAWAFIVSLNGTLCVFGLFGAPRIRDTFEVALPLALIPCFLFGVACTLAAVAADDFER